MDDQRTVNFLSNQLSLRKPQRDSLQILSDVLSQLGLSKDPDLQHWLSVIQQQYPTVKAFEREFPSLCFALATGVGKTRLMGAMIAWLFLTGRSRHFFVLAPNLTIYDKLKQDFNLGSPKYVFKGIAEFAQTPPVIITGDDYEDGRGVRLEYSVPASRTGDLFGAETAVHINIFNIAKINARDNKQGAKKSNVARMRRLQEYIGDSYFNHLAELPDLVVLMDEAHRYYASAGAKAINDLKPILGIELTATPKTVGANPRDFSNIIYHYPLSLALQDGYVKIPAVATRKDFNPKEYSAEQLETIKLEDGIHHHEYVKVELQTYAHQTGKPAIKPFMLVVAQDTTHASQLKALIQSDGFFEGRYKDKVIEVHSNQSGEESDEAMARLLAVEHDADTEIVIHVNKLKEGWDVTNLYTIVPLRASASEILTEQTIGRGLRLPYGKRTGVEAIDRLTIIAHDRFQEILDRAKQGDSIIHKTIYIGGGDDTDVPDKKPQLVETPSVLDMIISGKPATQDGTAIPGGQDSRQPTSAIETPQQRQIASTALEIIREETRKLPDSKALNQPEVQQAIAQKVQQRLQPIQAALPGMESASVTPASIAEVVKTVSETVITYTIDIPQIVILPTREVNYGFNDFDLQGLDKINYQPVSQEILLKHLEGDQDRHSIHIGDEQAQEIRLEDYIVRNLMDMNEIDYDSHAGLLYKLAGQIVQHLQSQWKEREKIENILLYYQQPLRHFVWVQMQKHQWSTPTDYQGKVTQGFDVLPPQTYQMAAGEQPRDFRAPLPNKQAVKKMLFTGFKRCCYPYQKFDSVDGELALAKVLEDDDSVLKWMKPASGKFKIEYQNGNWYEPDFVVETNNICLLMEPKRADEMDTVTVQAKQKAAHRWCHYANEHAAQIGGKRWQYVLIPHDKILSNMSVVGLVARFATQEKSL
jgi:type III restriction enzyme